ncbi:hypothetical protein BLNAU_17968 [Blattamonas nauphoetae]|uniref:Uncharacterized protein n=1 Tax=Blattamonas nauphoetae TaxID=2049346 RepID=A0ABQ9X5R4_9EUKA|nr:hypothetical protein BLNAU_17968 [Blattamonas nauphoetae]
MFETKAFGNHRNNLTRDLEPTLHGPYLNEVGAKVCEERLARELLFASLNSQRHPLSTLKSISQFNRTHPDCLRIPFGSLLRFTLYHLPTLEFVLSSPIVMTIPAVISFIEENDALMHLIFRINDWMTEWKYEFKEVLGCGKRMTKALFSEGFEDTLAQILMHTEGGDYCSEIREESWKLSRLLGLNPEMIEHILVPIEGEGR